MDLYLIFLVYLLNDFLKNKYKFNYGVSEESREVEKKRERERERARERERETGRKRERRKGEGQRRKEGKRSAVKYISLIYKITVH